MTIDTIADAQESVEGRPAEPSFADADRAARAHLLVSAVFLVVSLVLGLVVAIQLVFPSFLGGVAYLSYGRIEPAATHLFVYGWLTVGLIGAVYFSLARTNEQDIALGRQALGGLGLLTVGYLAGAIGILAGFSEGRPLVEAPLWADAIVLLGLIGVARIVTTTVRGSGRSGPVHWYLLAGVWWMLLLHIVGNFPGLTGVSSAVQGSFYRAGLGGLWLAAVGVGIVYFLIPRLSGRSAMPVTQMAVIGLWSLGLVWAMTASTDLTYGPTPDWVDTVGVIFAIGMIIPVAVIFADIVTLMRGRWSAVVDRAAVRYLMAGAVAFALLPLLNLLLALRSTSAVVGFTEWSSAYHFLAAGIAATFWLLAYAMVVGSDLGAAAPGAVRWQYRATLLGAVGYVGAILYGSVQAGLTWLGAANSAAFVNGGDGFRNTVEPLTGVYVIRLTGFAVYAAGLLWFVAGLLRTPVGATQDGTTAEEETRREDEPETAPAIDPDILIRRPLPSGRLLGNALVLFATAAVIALVLPSLEADQGEPTLLADTFRSYDEGSAEARGREIYLREGCQVCHTQAVRPIVTDVGLGPVSQPGDYAHETPALIGTTRIGPDLMHVASRLVDAEAESLAGGEGDPEDAVVRAQAMDATAEFVRNHLRDPRRLRGWSIMPAYDHLSSADIDALTAYVLSLN